MVFLLLAACTYQGEPPCRMSEEERVPWRVLNYDDGCGWGRVMVRDLNCGWGTTQKEPDTCHFTESYFCTNGVQQTTYAELGFAEPFYQHTTLRDISVPCSSSYELVER